MPGVLIRHGRLGQRSDAAASTADRLGPSVKSGSMVNPDPTLTTVPNTLGSAGVRAGSLVSL